VITDFFVFCGNIVSLSIFDDKESGTDSLAAYIVFESEANAKTALFLNTTSISGRSVSVELAPPNFTVPVGASTEGSVAEPAPLNEKTPLDDFMDSIATQVKAIDDEHSISQTVTAGVSTVSTSVSDTWNSVDSQLGISDTMKSVGTGISTTVQGIDQQYDISTKAQEVGSTVGGFISTASTTAITGLESATSTAIGGLESASTVAMTGIENATTAAVNGLTSIAESPQVQAGVATVKAVSNSIFSSIESLFVPNK